MNGKKVAPKTSGEKLQAIKEMTDGKARYYNLKSRTLKYEADNYTRLVVLDAGKGWYKMFSHSAIVYVCRLARRLSLKAELKTDTDYELTTSEPVYMFRDLDKFEGRFTDAAL